MGLRGKMQSARLRIAGSLVLLGLCVGTMGGCALMIRDCSAPQGTVDTDANIANYSSDSSTNAERQRSEVTTAVLDAQSVPVEP